MKKNNIDINNKKIAICMTLFYCAIGFVTIMLPLLFIGYIPQSLIGNYFSINSNLLFFTLPLILYFIYTGVYVFYVKIDQYVITISSFRSISSLISRKESIDISHSMLIDYKFFNNRFTFNEVLMLKIKTDSHKIIAKRFKLSLLRKKQKIKISKALDAILNNKK